MSNEVRDGPQTACCTYARLNCRADLANASMCGDFARVSPKHPNAGRKSSIAINNTLGFFVIVESVSALDLHALML